MSFSTRPLFLVGLLLAAACSDAGTPVDAVDRDRGQPVSVPENVLAVLTCAVDLRAGTETCAPAHPETGGARGGLIAIGDVRLVHFTTTNTNVTADSISYDRTITNSIPQALGTVDGTTAHATGVRVWVESPHMIDTAVAGQPTSVTVDNPDGTLTYKTYTNRPYFQYPGLLQPAATSIGKHWRFGTVNVDAFAYRAYVLAEVQFPKGWTDVTPANITIGPEDMDLLTARVRNAVGLQFIEPAGLTWTSSDPTVVVVTELTPSDTLAQITGVAQGTAWIRARSSSAADSLARRDSVLVTVN
jgi:hypothetical protein